MNEISSVNPSMAIRPIETPLLQERTVESSSGSATQQRSPLGDSGQQNDNGKPAQQGNAERTIATFLDAMQRQIQFVVDKETRRTIIKIVDPQTKEVVRQIPPDEALRISRMISRLVSDRGAVTDERI
ncbi:MAG: flagellar protein FlaG [Chlorobi bacterium]|nr:flagellar protein FlaG [Chlorobiota bacterium]